MKKKTKKKIPIRLPTAPPSKKHKDATKYDRKRDKKIPTESLSIKGYFDIQETKHAKDQASSRGVNASDRYIEEFQTKLDSLSSLVRKSRINITDFFEPELAYVYPIEGGGSFVITIPDRGTTPYPTLRIMTTLAPGMMPKGRYEFFKPALKRVQEELAKRKSFG